MLQYNNQTGTVSCKELLCLDFVFKAPYPKNIRKRIVYRENKISRISVPKNNETNPSKRHGGKILDKPNKIHKKENNEYKHFEVNLELEREVEDFLNQVDI